MKVDGSCHCGCITFKAEINPDHVVICHCTDCQTFSSAPYRVSVFGVPAGNVDLKGTPKTYVKTGGSGKKVITAFCGDCGSALFSTKDHTAFNLRVGTLKQRDELPPVKQGFCGSGMPWAMNIEGIEKVPDPVRS